MPQFDGSLARKLDFGDVTTTQGPLRQAQATASSGGRAGLRLALPSGVLSTGSGRVLRGPDKYKALEKRRRQAQIRARHALGLLDLVDGR